MSNQDLSKIYGEPGRGEYDVGDTITFEELRKQLTGEVIHINAPGTTAGGRAYPTSYQVDCGDGFPHVVYQNQIIVSNE